MTRYLDPKADITFKRVFGDPDNKDRCISMLNALLPLEKGREVVDVEFQSGEIWPTVIPIRNTIADVRCRDNEGRQFLVEMQMEWTSDFKTRILFNASKAYVSQFDINKQYTDIKTVYSLNFINSVFDRDPASAETYYHHYALYERENPKQRIEGLEFILIELPKFKVGAVGGNPTRDLWLRFLTEMKDDFMTIPAGLAVDKTVKSAIQCLELGAYSKEQMLGYDNFWNDVRTLWSLSNEKFNKGKAEGMAQGKVEGKAEGLLEGETKANLENARKMLAAGIPKETIAQITGICL